MKYLPAAQKFHKWEKGTCVRITTGAPMPVDADTVVNEGKIPRIDRESVVIAPGTAHCANVRPAGGDYAKDDAALKRGDVLTPSRVAVLASFGHTHATIAEKPRAILFTTGDELTAPGNPLSYGRIYDSNRFSIGGLIEQHGAHLIRHERLRDDPEILIEALKRAGEEGDIIVTSGGVSAGEADYLPRILAQIGKVYFWKVRIKPGMPFLFGQVGKALMFALPGNPVSGIATFLTLVAPAVRTMLGANETSSELFAKLSAPISKRHGRAEFLTCAHCLQLERSTACNSVGEAGLGHVARRGGCRRTGRIAGRSARIRHWRRRGRVIPMPGWPV